MVGGGRYIVLLPLQELGSTGIEDALRTRAEGIRARQANGTATDHDVEALAAIEHILATDEPKPSNGEKPNGKTADPPMLLKIDEVARLLSVSSAHVYNLVSRGEIPSVRIGKSLRVRRDELLEWLDELTQDQQRYGGVGNGR